VDQRRSRVEVELAQGGTVKLLEPERSIAGTGLAQATLAMPVTSAQVVKARARAQR
jgi:hypothetical protein